MSSDPLVLDKWKLKKKSLDRAKHAIMNLKEEKKIGGCKKQSKTRSGKQRHKDNGYTTLILKSRGQRCSESSWEKNGAESIWVLNDGKKSERQKECGKLYNTLNLLKVCYCSHGKKKLIEEYKVIGWKVKQLD